MNIYQDCDHEFYVTTKHLCEVRVTYGCGIRASFGLAQGESNKTSHGTSGGQGPTEADVLYLLEINLILGRCLRNLQARLLLKGSAGEGKALELILFQQLT